MNETWVRIRKQNRRERLRKWFRISCGIMALLYFLLFHVVPRIIVESDLKDQSSESNRIAKAAEPLVGTLERSLNQTPSKQARQIEKFASPSKQSTTITSEIQDVATAAPQPAFVPPPTTLPASEVEPSSADLAYSEFRKQTRGKGAREILTAIVRFRDTNPNHPRLKNLEKSLIQLSRTKWLAMASEELKDASPDDAGFAEGWLPIASAWQLVGNDAETREAMRQAIQALPRMTLPERVIESTIEICQHQAFEQTSARQHIENAEMMCEQVSAKWSRGTYYANLSGLASKLGHPNLGSKLLERALSMDNMNIEYGTIGKPQNLVLTQQARAASWTKSSEEILAICTNLEKLNYPKAVTNALAYSHAAIAAARNSDRTQFNKCILLAENALSPVRVYDFPNYHYASRIAEANILQRRWRAAVIIANNIPDPYARASLLFRVMKDAPQEVRAKNLPSLFEKFAEQRWASQACSGHAEYRIRSNESLLSVASWIESLPLHSQRAAAFAGISRTVGTLTVADKSDKDLTVAAPIAIEDGLSLLNEAERAAQQMKAPLEAASAWLGIARTWKLLGKTQRYQQAVANVDDRLFDAWTEVWELRPPVKRSYNGGFIDTDDRHRDDEEYAIRKIVACHRHLAEMQTDMGDSRGATESLLNLANAAGFLSATATYNDENFLQIKAMLSRLYGATGVGPDSIPHVKHYSHRYTRTLLAAWAKDISELEAALPDLVKRSNRIGGSAKEKSQPARAYGDLAVLHAERGNTKAYRDARRSAQSLITQGKASSKIKLILATADALAGEFALAESNLVRGKLKWFGDANRPRKQLAVSLAEDGQWEKASEYAEQISRSESLYRSEAWTAVAKARVKNNSDSPVELLDWGNSFESQIDRAAVLCGFALAADGR